MAKFKVGDRVRLIDSRTGMFIRTVQEAEDGSVAYECRWEVKAVAHYGTFAEEKLQAAPARRGYGFKRVTSLG